MYYFTPPLWIAGLLMVWMSAAGALPAAEFENSADTRPERPAFHTLSNADLLKQTETVLAEADAALLSQQRALATQVFVLEQNRQRFTVFQLPVFSDHGLSPYEQAKADAEAAKTRLEAHHQRLELIQAVITALNHYFTEINKTQTALEVLENSILSLELNLLEIRLRVADGTLDGIPARLERRQLELRREQLGAQKITLGEQLATARAELQAMETYLAQEKNSIIEAEAAHDAAQKKYARELKRHTVEQTYRGRPATALRAVFTHMQEELPWFVGTFEFSFSRFQNAKAKTEQAQQQLEALAPPPSLPLSEDNGSIQTEAVEQISAAIQALISYHTQKTQQLNALGRLLQPAIETGEHFQGDATVLTEHLFKMHVIAGLLAEQDADLPPVKKGGTEAAEVQVEDLATLSDRVSTALAAARAATRQAKERLKQLEPQIEQSESERTEASARLIRIEKQYKTSQEALKWENKLRQLSHKQLIDAFTEEVTHLSDNENQLAKIREAHQTATAAASRLQQHFDVLTDPLLRQGDDEQRTDNNQAIVKKLYSLAELELPPALHRKPVPPATDPAAVAEADSAPKPDDAEPVPSITDAHEQRLAETLHYQKLLTTHNRFLDEKQRVRTELLNALQTLARQAKTYADTLADTISVSLQHYANAVELKKRLGRREIQHDEIPEGITQALQRDSITRLESELTALNAGQAVRRRHLEILERPNQTFSARKKYLARMLEAIGKRLDILQQLKNHEQDFHQDKETLSEMALKSLQQSVNRRLHTDDTTREKLFGLISAGSADSLTDLLRIYYEELLALEKKQENLRIQKDKTERLVSSVTEEHAAISELVLVLQQKSTELELEQEEAWINIQARLKPKQAEEIIGQFEHRTGRRLPVPLPVREDHKQETIAAISRHLRARALEIDTVGKWLALFEQRLTPAGLATETGHYQDRLGEIDARGATLQRRIEHLTGHPKTALHALSAEEKPRTAGDFFRFLHGEIGATRAERQKVRAEAATWVFAEVGAILLGALLIAWLTALIIRHLIRRAKAADNITSQQTVFVLSFINTSLKLIIWTTTFVLVLSGLGFNIGAILAGLGIGGLAVAMAARESLANILGGIMIFIERPFKIGDTIKVGSLSTMKVMDMTWRSTLLIDHFGYSMNIPNNEVAGSHIVNYSRSIPSGDYIQVHVSPEQDPNLVMQLIEEALADCDGILQDQPSGVIFAGVKVLQDVSAACYWPWWYISDYTEHRYQAREKVWLKIIERLNNAGISLVVNNTG